MSAAPASDTSRFDPNFTQHVIDSIGPNTSPRMREVMGSLTKHLHDPAREVEPTVDEWMKGVQLINWAGQMSNDKRNEGQLLCDVIGLESLVDEITYKKASEATTFVTRSAILGPFFRTDHPIRDKGATISFNTPDDAEVVYMNGRVLDAKTKKPLSNASVDMWEASTNDANGEYAFYCIKPTAYPVPDDGLAGKLLDLLDHSKYLDNDSVFAVQDSLLVEFVPRSGDEKAKLELNNDVYLAPLE
ncbi:hypothetical protein LTR28_006317 [Elasticomyces elasticus]|nr:hypothetical protein LTR28_006317 [Elasticomyces elasticus]